MKKRVQGLVAAALAGIILASGTVFAKQATEKISVIYDNIKILIDGKEFKPTDVNGNAVEPFIYNGTTYLPVRAIANAFDKDVDWEAQTSTVTLGTKNYDWLDQMGFADYSCSTSNNTFEAISEDTEMSDGIKYDRGLLYYLYDHSYFGGTIEDNEGNLECYQNYSYLLNSNYKTFEGVIADLDDSENGSAIIKFYGDGQLLYTSPIISEGMKSTKFNVDVSSVKLLKIHVEFFNTRDSGYQINACIADARLSKK